MKAVLHTVVVALAITLVKADIPSAEERKAILDYHNQVRADVSPTATNMKKMVRLLFLPCFVHFLVLLYPNTNCMAIGKTV